MTDFIEKMLSYKDISVPSEHLEQLAEKWQQMESMKKGLSETIKDEDPIALVHIPSGKHVQN